MKKYDRLIRFYDSWFGDLLDPEKEFDPEECWKVVIAIRECQRDGNTSALDDLPKNIKRALQMATLRTQIEKIIEKTSRMSERGKAGAQAAGSARYMENKERKLEEELKNPTPAEIREEQDKQFDEQLKKEREKAISYEEYQRRKREGLPL